MREFDFHTDLNAIYVRSENEWAKRDAETERERGV